MASKNTKQQPQRLNETDWTDLTVGLASIYNGQRMSPQRYMELYTKVFNFCSTSNSGLPEKPPALRQQQSNGAEFVGSELYNALKAFVQNYAQQLKEQLDNLHGEQLLQCYMELWTTYKFGSWVVNGVFSYLNRHWIKREKDEGKSEVFEVYNLAINIWKEEIFELLNNKITTAALALIEQDRNGEMIQNKFVKVVVESYIELGINERDDAAPPVQGGGHVPAPATQNVRPSAKYRIYRDNFQARLLAETQYYYIKESTAFLKSYSVPEYMKKVEDRIAEERDRCQLYLDHTTLGELLKKCDEALITQHLELFHNEFEALLSQRLIEHLGRMYELCARVPTALDKLKSVLEQYIAREGRAAIQQIAQSAMNDPKQYISTILELYSTYNNIVVEAFKQDSGFVEAMDKAFTRFINDNEITRLAKSASKSPHLLVLYCDQLLRKSARNVEDERMEEFLEEVMTVFKYIEDKDMFQAFFQKMLCKRLVMDASASEEAERSMIAKLKHMCGFEYTSKLERLLTDVSLSRDNSDSFRKSQGNKLSVDFSVIVIMSNVWPLGQSVQFVIPAPLMDCIEAYKSYYSSKYTGRKLNWVLHVSRGELTSTVGTFAQKYTFTCNSQQIAVLMLYNQRDQYTIDELATQLNFPREQLTPVVQSLVKINLLSGTEDTNYSFNPKFTNKKLKVDLVRAMATGKEVKKDSEDVQKSVDEDRKLVIQAAIVRIMKMRKTLKHQQLVGEVLNQLTARFQPKVPMVKKCIDILIEKEYMKRADNERDTYEYVA